MVSWWSAVNEWETTTSTHTVVMRGGEGGVTPADSFPSPASVLGAPLHLK